MACPCDGQNRPGEAESPPLPWRCVVLAVPARMLPAPLPGLRAVGAGRRAGCEFRGRAASADPVPRRPPRCNAVLPPQLLSP